MTTIILAPLDHAWEKVSVKDLPLVYVRAQPPKLELDQKKDCLEVLASLNSKKFVWKGKTIQDEEGIHRVYEEVVSD